MAMINKPIKVKIQIPIHISPMIAYLAKPNIDAESIQCAYAKPPKFSASNTFLEGNILPTLCKSVKIICSSAKEHQKEKSSLYSGI